MRLLILLLALLLTAPGLAATYIVDPQKGPYRTIQAAVDASMATIDEPALVRIGAGTYREKVYIRRNNLALVGAGPDRTFIVYPELRSEWLKQNPNDWGAAVVNLEGNDLALLDLTVENSYGRETGDHDHQFAVRLAHGTRIITDNCALIAGGADTLSLWDKQGMYYHSNCYFEGYVDTVCPRGWAHIANSRFYTRGGKYALWHDGEKDESQKLVVVNGQFDGEPGFQLGRRHYDAQFWLINPVFSAAMADQPIFRKTYPEEPARDRPNRWGHRVYFYGARHQGEPLSWTADNLPVPVAHINPVWTFGGRWNPEQDLAQWRAMMGR